MSRISKWKLEKTKVKVVFRLQFHATHIPQSGWDKLFITFVPADSGKATAKTNKANVRNGTCKWADPIYETTRLLQDSKSRQYDEKLYKIVVAMGTSRASILGEATINLADYVDALKPSAITLPLHGCNFETILHVTVQLLTSKTGFREFEQQRELRETGIQPGTESHGPVKIPFSEEAANDQTDKTSSRVECTSPDANEEYANSVTGFDGSSNTSGTHEPDNVIRSRISGDLHRESPYAVKQDPSDHRNTTSTGSANSTDNELAMAFEENNRLVGCLELAESSIFDLKLEVNSLQTLADELGAETRRFSHQLSAETSSAEDLAKEVSVVKSECLKFKDDINKLNDLISRGPQIRLPETRENQADHLVRNARLRFSEGVAVVESKIRDLQSKTYLVSHDGVTKFIYSELEALLGFLLDFKNGDMAKFPNAIPSETESSTFNLGLDLCQPVSILQNFSTIPPVSEVADTRGVVDAMKGQILELVRELDEAKVENEALTRKTNQMECYYEAFIHDLEENQKRELENLRNEHSACVYSLSISESEKESLRRDMNQQTIRSADERRELEAVNEELERRCAASETALRRARLNYSIAVDKLQNDLQILSSQVTSMFETNENLMKQVLSTKTPEFQNQNSRSVGRDILSEELKRSLRTQEERRHEIEKEVIEMYSINLNLDIYSRAIQESLCEANEELSLRLEQQGSENEKLTNEISVLKERSMIVKAKSDELVSFKENLEENLDFVQCRLANLLASYYTQFRFVDNFQSVDLESADVKDAVLQLEQIQRNLCTQYFKTMEENQNLKSERAIADVSVSTFRSEIRTMRRKLKSGTEDMASKLDKLQYELESVANKLRSSSEIEEKYSQMNNALLADFAILEDHMQELACDLAMRLHDKTEECVELSNEISRLKETSKILHEEKAYKDELEEKVRDLNFHLNEDQGKLRNLEQQNDELTRELTSDLEVEKSRLARLLDQQNVFIEELKRKNFYQDDLERQLLEMHDHSLAADVKLIYVANHYESMTEELLQKLGCVEEINSQASEIERIRNTMIDAEDEICNLAVSKEELEISIMVLKRKIHEQSEHEDELSRKLSEQVLKTEEFRNLSNHLKEFKHNTGHDSLRIAFMKEQYETQIQELKQQVSISRKHGEEMLLKLQDSIDEIENRKKSEAMISKKNEDLLLRLSSFEAELRSALAEKREKSNAYDRINAELECALLSLECCKEEKEKLGASLLDFEAAKSQLDLELTSVKGQQLEKLKSSTTFEKDEHFSSDEPVQLQMIQDAARTGLCQNRELLAIEESPQSKYKSLDFSIENTRVQRLKSSMDHLHDELEKMKNENQVFDMSCDVDLDFEVRQREIMKLHKVNEELGSTFPLFNEISVVGNALERVLELEIDLAEALKAKNKSNVIFQSSFTKQHSDEEAVLRSFRDINEVVKETLELKERHACLEAELRHMHDRYSQLSLHFSEVEGERKKLEITLRNLRASRKLVTLNESSSSSAIVMDHPS